VERLGIALEPEADYERRSDGGGCEDPRITFVEPIHHYVMTYTALSLTGPRIALAMSEDLFHWERIGLATFAPYHGIDFVHVDNKDASIFPVAIPNHAGKMQRAMLHRPFSPALFPRKLSVRISRGKWISIVKSIWISYCPMPPEGLEPHRPGLFNSHHRLATPVSPWECLKIGGGAPPVLMRHGWFNHLPRRSGNSQVGQRQTSTVLFGWVDGAGEGASTRDPLPLGGAGIEPGVAAGMPGDSVQRRVSYRHRPAR
jgi:predicted GH43/DUF377 family glycosyl hydrolase